MIKLINLSEKKEEALNLAEEAFGHLGVDVRQALSNTDWGVSRGIDLDGELVGIYLLTSQNEPFGKIKGSGLHGLALAINPKHQGSGLSKILLNYAYSLGYDYIWGMHLKGLNNVQHWLKSRKLLAETADLYFTYKVLS